jgi:hypothetical protein
MKFYLDLKMYLFFFFVLGAMFVLIRTRLLVCIVG